MVNYFELYDIPVSFHPDAAAVKSKFYELSHKYHPDHFVQAAGPAQLEALQMASLNNAAYKTLSTPDATIAYVLKLNGLLEDEEKYILPPDFLMEMMDLNEAISDYEMEQDNEALKEQSATALTNQLAQWQDEAGALTKGFVQDAQNNDLLLKIKDYYFRKKYLLRIQERINRFAPHQ